MTNAKRIQDEAKGDDSRADASAYFTLPFDTRDVWGKAKVPVRVTINGYTWRSTVGNRGGQQYIVVNAAARGNAGVRAGDVVTITLEPDSEKREIEIPSPLQKALGTKLVQKLLLLAAAGRRYLRPASVPKAPALIGASRVVERSMVETGPLIETNTSG